MRLLSANDPRNYVAQFGALARALCHHALIATVLPVVIYTLGEWLVFPVESARALTALFATPTAQADHVAVLAVALHTIASLTEWTYETVFTVLLGARMMFSPPASLFGAFHEDLYRRIRLLVGTPVRGTMSISRLRRA